MIHLQVVLANRKGKETKERFYLYNPRAEPVGPQPARSIEVVCHGGCDDSMDVLFAQLRRLQTPR